MLKEFKFLRIKKPERLQPGYIKFKDQFNRNKIMLINWCEYGHNVEFDDNRKTFSGNILQFYEHINFMKRCMDEPITPKIYEIYIRETGYFESTRVIGNQDRFDKFIRRKAKLVIVYSLNYNI